METEPELLARALRTLHVLGWVLAPGDLYDLCRGIHDMLAEGHTAPWADWPLAALHYHGMTALVSGAHGQVDSPRYRA